MNNEEKRANALRAREDHIGRALSESEKTGELRAAPSYGKPLDFGDGYDDTPAELRMPMKVLKDAGVVPHEVALMREAAALQADRRWRRCSDLAGTAQAARRAAAEHRAAARTPACEWVAVALHPPALPTAAQSD